MESNWDILGYSAEPILSSGITLELFAPYVARPRKPATEIFRHHTTVVNSFVNTTVVNSVMNTTVVNSIVNSIVNTTAVNTEHCTTTECQMTLLDTCLCLQTK